MLTRRRLRQEVVSSDSHVGVNLSHANGLTERREDNKREGIAQDKLKQTTDSEHRTPEKDNHATKQVQKNIRLRIHLKICRRAE